MAKRVLTILVAAGACGFFVGSVMENELVYTVSACVAVYAGLALTILANRTRT